MAVTHSTAIRNSLANVIQAAADAGTTNPSARILIRDASNVLLATLTMSNPAFTTATNGRVTPNTITAESSAPATGTASKFELVDRDAAVILTGTITASGGGGDMTINRVSINTGDTVSAVSFNYNSAL